MKNSKKIMMAASLAAGLVAYVVARRRNRQIEKEEYRFFKKSRHLTPAFAKNNKYS